MTLVVAHWAFIYRHLVTRSDASWLLEKFRCSHKLARMLRRIDQARLACISHRLVQIFLVTSADQRLFEIALAPLRSYWNRWIFENSGTCGAFSLTLYSVWSKGLRLVQNGNSPDSPNAIGQKTPWLKSRQVADSGTVNILT